MLESLLTPSHYSNASLKAQLCTSHSPLLAGYLHHIVRRDSATCPHCNDANETAEHLVLQCPAHNQARQNIWPGGKFNPDPQRLWDFLVTCPTLTGNEKKTEHTNLFSKSFCVILHKKAIYKDKNFNKIFPPPSLLFRWLAS